MPLLVDCHPWLNSGLLPHPTVGARSNIGVDVLRVSEFGSGVGGFVENALAYFSAYLQIKKNVKKKGLLKGSGVASRADSL